MRMPLLRSAITSVIALCTAVSLVGVSASAVSLNSVSVSSISPNSVNNSAVAATSSLPGFDESRLDFAIEHALEQFYTPGMSVAVVHGEHTIYAKGFGLANIARRQAVSPETYFRLASTSKAFTAAAVSILVDEGKLAWDDLVIDHIPHFRMQDDYATLHFTVEDLLTHKSGLLSGAGDSMIWPEPSGFTRQEVIKNLRYLTPEYEFSRRYAYSNVMYITAGELVAKLSGQSFEDFVDERIFKALDMPCFTGAMPPDAVAISAMSYGHSDAKGIYPIPRNAITGEAQMSAAAGGMVCNANGMAKWISALLRPNSSILSSEQLDKMWQPHTILGVSDIEHEWNHTHFKSYGLGWRLSNEGRFKVVSHTGTLSGYQAFVVLIPELNAGAVVLNNGSNYGARGSVMQSIVKMLMNEPEHDWVHAYVEYQKEQEQRYLARAQTPTPTAGMSINMQQLLGTYRDAWFEDFTIFEESGEVRIASSRMTTLTGTIENFQDTSFKIVWDNQNAASDAFLHAELDLNRNITGFKLHPFGAHVQLNHEWRDMHFKKVAEQ
ncbi:serine hydrolase [Glaciecola siphonariae]|uniref:Serine hydrolase n=1 Tax=Glaciecola siphonariae TaxID=521012 RepID=A0ABV9LWX5_9ALTE